MNNTIKLVYYNKKVNNYEILNKFKLFSFFYLLN